jgi:hypothetical protein
MNWRARTPAIVAVTIAGLLAACTPEVVVYGPKYYQEAQDVEGATNGGAFEWLGLTANGWIAWLTLALTIATAYMYFVMRKTLEETKVATGHTKRSVDNYIDNERGIIRMVDARSRTYSDGVKLIYFTVGNVGNGLATVEQIDVGYELLPNIKTKSSPAIKRHVTSRMRGVVQSGKVMTCGGSYREGTIERREDPLGFNPEVPDEISKGFRGSGKLIAARYRIIYYTVFGIRYEVVETIVFDGDGEYHFEDSPVADRIVRKDDPNAPDPEYIANYAGPLS